ncbi:hypothetical protein FOZ61_008917 [Perkinsus olseni]|uniref:Uncharacterized protein n=1 Tax=Perkinsus olseni TaxID=32597 RepID=A0A7J6L8T2_PEROL|nr:hypothetical protein FOZ61_008917 [Perkinsus olseni]KAF4655604.1 hypothetical protein FOL46_008189 [Perkinsus olseni]
MPTRNTFIGASVAAVMTANLGNALGSLSPHANAFPAQTKASVTPGTPGLEPTCRYGSDEPYEESWRGLEIVLHEDVGLTTSFIACPTIGRQEAFEARFDGPSPGILRRYTGFTNDPNKNFFFNYVPDNTGVDPLRSLDVSALGDVLNRVHEVRDYLEGKQLDVGEMQAVVAAMNDFCPALMGALKKEYRIFSNLCKKYSTVAKATVRAVGAQGWNRDVRGRETYVSMIPGEDEVDAPVSTAGAP